MGFFDALFGRTRPVPLAKTDRLFAISTADVTLRTEEEMQPARTAGICFQGIASTPFRQIQDELQALLKVAATDSPTTARPYEDKLGYKWILMDSTDFQGLVTTIHMVSQSLTDEGYGEQLLAAIFRFDDAQGRPNYFIYNFKRGAYYPFVPRPDSHSHNRNNPDEMRLGTILGKEMPIEKDLERWYAMWDLPF